MYAPSRHQTLWPPSARPPTITHSFFPSCVNCHTTSSIKSALTDAHTALDATAPDTQEPEHAVRAAGICSELGKTWQARRLLLQALGAHPRNADVLAALGILEFEMGSDLDRALSYLRSALQADPGHPYAQSTYRELLECMAESDAHSSTDEDKAADGDGGLECAEIEEEAQDVEYVDLTVNPHSSPPPPPPPPHATSGGAEGASDKLPLPPPAPPEPPLHPHPLSRAASARRARVFSEYLSSVEIRSGVVESVQNTDTTSSSAPLSNPSSSSPFPPPDNERGDSASSSQSSQ